ncbi:MAG: ABC transporter permease, partial [Mesorhizobium sp.]
MSSPVVKLVAQRVALGILLLLAVSVLIFAGTQILPGDVAQAI